MWLHRDLSLKGRTLFSKAEGLLAYFVESLYVDTKTIDQSLFNYVWKHKHIRKSVVLNNYEIGILSLFDQFC